MNTAWYIKNVILPKTAKKIFNEYDANIVPILETPNFVLEFQTKSSIFSLCNRNILMLDFDEEPDFSKNDILEFIKSNVKDELFYIYETDRGIHAFLVSEYKNYEESLEYHAKYAYPYENSRSYQDPYYVAYSGVKGYCVRLSPKIYEKFDLKKIRSTYDLTDEEWKKFIFSEEGRELIDLKLRQRRIIYNKNEFVSKYHSRIGSGKAIPEIVNMLNAQQEMIDYFIKLYLNGYQKLIGSNYPSSISQKSVKMISDYFKDILKNNNVKYTEGIYYYGEKKFHKYQNILPKSGYGKCLGRNATLALKEAKDRHTYWAHKNCLEQIYFKPIFNKEIYSKFDEEVERRGLDGTLNPIEEFPFIIGFDRRTNIYYMAFRSLLMLDWDVKDGYPKDSVLPLLNSYLENESGYLFKIYETDNGTHAYLISEKSVFDTKKSAKILTDTCVDYQYILFALGRGFYVRLSQKQNTKDQFVQKLGLGKDNITLVGRGKVDPYLDDLSELCNDISDFIVDKNYFKEYENKENVANIIERQKIDILVEIYILLTFKYPELLSNAPKEDYDWVKNYTDCDWLKETA